MLLSTIILLQSRITNRLKSLSTADIDPENAVEELMEMFENDNDEEKDDTNKNEHLDDQEVENEETNKCKVLNKEKLLLLYLLYSFDRFIVFDLSQALN